MDWDAFDFAMVGVLLAGAGLACLLASKAAPKHRAVAGVVVLAAVLLVWAELAVGVFGSPIAGQ
jgi:hypothetical protein